MSAFVDLIESLNRNAVINGAFFVTDAGKSNANGFAYRDNEQGFVEKFFQAMRLSAFHKSSPYLHLCFTY